MKIEDIENIELVFLSLEDYAELRQAMILSYRTMPDSLWEEYHIKTLIDKFPEGQVVIKINGEIAGCALSLIVDHEKIEVKHTYAEITGDFT